MEEGYKHSTFKMLIDKSLFYLVFGLTLFATNKYVAYSSFFVLLFYHGINLLLQTKPDTQYNNYFKYFPILLILVWIYGVFLGLSYGNDNTTINNVGIIFFFTYYSISYVKLSNKQIMKILLNISVICLLTYLLNLDEYYFSISNLTQRLGYSMVGIFPIILAPLLIYNTFFNGRNVLINGNILNVILLFLVLLVSARMTASKGIYLSLIVSLFIIYYSKMKLINWWKLILIVGVVFTIWSNITTITIFGEGDVSNLLRYRQLDSFLNGKELTFFGEGWGARFSNFVLVNRDPAGYSTELSYLNLVDKVGVFSLIFFVFYFWCLYYSFILIRNRNKELILIGLFSTGLLSYYFLSLGNPTLFAPTFVFMNVIAIHMINKQLITSKQ